MSTKDFRDIMDVGEKGGVHQGFLQWQNAQVATMIFGSGYVPIPPIPEGYEKYALAWYKNQIRMVGRDSDWGWDTPAENNQIRIPAL